MDVGIEGWPPSHFFTCRSGSCAVFPISVPSFSYVVYSSALKLESVDSSKTLVLHSVRSHKTVIFVFTALKLKSHKKEDDFE